MNYLFVCNGNVARSQEAEAFFEILKTDKDDHAFSGGINVKLGKPIDPLVVEVMSEIDVDVSNARRKFVDEAMVDLADVIVSFKPIDELPDFLQSRSDIVFWEVSDPQHQDVEFHRQTRDKIKALITNLL